MNTDIRWKQRFDNYSKAVAQMTEFIGKGELNKFEILGLIQCFGFTFELAWKTMKDYLLLEGFDVKSPRATIQTAYQNDLIIDGHHWMDALEKRNLLVHTYNEELVKETHRLIVEIYYAMFVALVEVMEEFL